MFNFENPCSKGLEAFKNIRLLENRAKTRKILVDEV